MPSRAGSKNRTSAQVAADALARNQAAAQRQVPIRAAKSLEVRSRIQVSMILNNLAEHVAGKRNMTATQVSAAKILLDKSLPDLHTTTLQTEGGNPITLTISADDATVL